MLGYNKDQVTLSRRIVLKRNLNIYKYATKMFLPEVEENVLSKPSVFK
jgi:hypothetical protein